MFQHLVMLKIGICYLAIGEEYKTVTRNSRNNKLLYCHKHGYTFIEDDSVYDPSRTIPWSKLHLLLKYIDQYSYIVWVDADMLIMNDLIRVEDFIVKYSEYEIIIGSDWKIPNTGFMILKNTPYVKQVLNHILTYEYDIQDNNRYQNHEQGSFIHMIDNNVLECGTRVKITSPREMNSYWFCYYPGDFLIHLAGCNVNLLNYALRETFPNRLDDDTDESYNTRMVFLAGPIREQYDQRLANHNG